MDVLLRTGTSGMDIGPKIYIITGETSGEYHAGMLLSALKSIEPALQARGWGGDSLTSAGMEIDIRYESANFMGFVEVLRNLPQILNLFRVTKKSIIQYKPDFLLLVDYPGFNLRMAKWAHSHNIPVIYFIAPQVWAWKESRVNLLKQYVKKLFVILPFELEYFRKHHIDTSYHGHPLLEKIIHFHSTHDFRENWKLDQRSIIALLPGSRKQEIQTMLPDYLKAVRHETKYQVVIAGMKRHQSVYEKLIMEHCPDAMMVYDDMYSLLKHAEVAIVTSGTASLEAALFEVPMVVCYKGNWISYQIAKRLVKIKYIALANLIVDQKIIEELIQQDCNPGKIHEEITRLLIPENRRAAKKQLQGLRKLLFEQNCYKKIAKDMTAFMHTYLNT